MRFQILDLSLAIRPLLPSLAAAIGTMITSLTLRGREVMLLGVKIINRSLGQPSPTGGNWVDPAPYAVHCGLDPGLSGPANHHRLFQERIQSRAALCFLGQMSI